MSLELLALGSKFLGGLMGNRNERKQMRMAQHQFDQQMDHSVRRRVEDAKRAGVHPLFAMGASVGASPTLNAGGGTGSSMGNALESMAETLGVIEQNRASAKKDEAEAALMDSERKRLEQEMSSRGRDTPTVKTSPLPDSVYRGRGIEIGPAEYVSPQVAKSQAPGLEAGTHPEKIEVKTRDGRTIELPSPNLGLDEVGQVEYVRQKAINALSDFLTKARPYVSDAAIMAKWKEINRNLSGRIRN